MIGKYKGIPIYVSDKPNKKYYALVDNKKVYFGERGYQHYYDIMKYYSKDNHLNKKRRDLYYKRHGLAKKYSPKYFSHKILWPIIL